jgi:hypothetical protein
MENELKPKKIKEKKTPIQIHLTDSERATIEEKAKGQFLKLAPYVKRAALLFKGE